MMCIFLDPTMKDFPAM